MNELYVIILSFPPAGVAGWKAELWKNGMQEARVDGDSKEEVEVLARSHVSPAAEVVVIERAAEESIRQQLKDLRTLRKRLLRRCGACKIYARSSHCGVGVWCDKVWKRVRLSSEDACDCKHFEAKDSQEGND